jgi:hypothetical protein
MRTLCELCCKFVGKFDKYEKATLFNRFDYDVNSYASAVGVDISGCSFR